MTSSFTQPNMSQELHEDSVELAKSIEKLEQDGNSVITTLATDEKVIARITDGIYRQPASALRELISNAYDADAANVSIQTNYPRFDQIVIRDDGNGMGKEALANLVLHIGGSTKRDELGKKIGVTSSEDAKKTIAGRNIIGKIGIGLFSVAQLTQQFQIITKVKGNDYRLIADVTLRTFVEEDSSDFDKSAKFESGQVEIRKVKANDKETQGTDIILINLRKNALAILRSNDIWTKSESVEEEVKKHKFSPTYHIGQFSKGQDRYYSSRHEMNLPWKYDVDPSERFRSIYSAVLDEVGKTSSNPTLEKTFDNYFQMIWTLALSSPIDYIEKHPFALQQNTDEPTPFEISNLIKGKAEPINLENKTYKTLHGTWNPSEDPAGGFSVNIDGMRLYRPLAFNNQKKSNSALKKSLIFYGHYIADYGTEKIAVTGGELEFEGYFYWNSKILPRDHNGISIRINNASGTLFDSKFLGYPVAERTTLSQLTAEIFVVKGLDAALNIDRESFNYAHPHYQILSKWVFNALRQVTAKQKSLRAQTIKEKRLQIHNDAIKGLYETQGAKRISTSGEEFPKIENDRIRAEKLRDEGETVFIKSEIFNKNVSELIEHKLLIIVAILRSRELMSELSHSEQESLVKEIAEVLEKNT